MSEYTCAPICGPFNLGEGPHWQQTDGCLCFVDAFLGDVFKLNVNSKQLERKHVGGVATIIIPWQGNADHFVVSRDHELLQLEWSTGNTKSIAFIEKDELSTRFNDGKCDRNNRLWVGTMGIETAPAVVTPDLGSLYSVDKDYQITRQVKNVSLSNGIAWSVNNQNMYFADSVKRKVYIFDYDAHTGKVSNQRVFVDYEKHGKPNEVPDGMTVDTTGKVWIAGWDGERVIRVDPETAQIVNELKVENVSRVTSLCFGGPELNKIYLTSSWKGLTDEQRKAQPLAGSVFEVTCNKENVKGFVGDCFGGKPL